MDTDAIANSSVLKRRRHTSVEAWSKADIANLNILLFAGSEIDGAQGSKKRTEEEHQLQMEHTFELLMQQDLEWEVVHGIIGDLTLPERPASEYQIPKKQIVFPAHVVGLYCIKLWQHGLSSKMSQILDTVIQSISFQITPESIADHSALFWVSNLIELDCILVSTSHTAESTSSPTIGSAVSRRMSVYMAGDHVIRSLRPKIHAAICRTLTQWYRPLKKQLEKLIEAAVLRSQTLNGFVTSEKPRTSSVFSRFTSSATEDKYSMEQLLDLLTSVWKAMKYYNLGENVILMVFHEIFVTIADDGFNNLVMKQSYATWKRGMQIQYNISRLRDWSESREISDVGLHLERLMQAAKLLQLTKARPTNLELYLEDMFDICNLLNPSQISKLLRSYSVSDFENPISPEVLNKVAEHASRKDTPNNLLITLRPESDNSWIKVPEPHQILALEKYLPQELEESLPRVLLLFKFSS